MAGLSPADEKLLAMISSLNALPDRQLEFLTNAMAMNVEGFGVSSDETVQHLLEQHNRNRLALESIRCEGSVDWHSGSGPRPFALRFRREDFAAALEFEDFRIEIGNGLAAYSRRWGEEFRLNRPGMEAQFLQAFAVFDPAEFRSAGNASLSLPAAMGQLEETIEAHQLRSGGRTLAFDTQTGNLRQITFHDPNGGAPYFSITLSQYVEVSGIAQPTSLLLRVLDKERFRASALDIQDIHMTIDPRHAAVGTASGLPANPKDE